MAEPLILHYAPDNASLCVRLALLALDAPFRTVLVDRRTGAAQAPAYLALNPNGLIPALETPDGAMFETAAILLWLADRDPAGRLAPRFDHPDRGRFLTWLFWLSNTLHPALRILFYPDKHIDSDHAKALVTRTQERVQSMLDILNAAVPTLDGWVGLPQTPILDCYLCPMLRWLALYPRGNTAWFDLSGWPHLHRIAATMDIRPITATASRAEGLGPTPFSRPRLPNPPEGSAT